MEKNDIKIFELFHSELKDDIWSKFFFISLCGNIRYYKYKSIHLRFLL